ncbi:MAG: transposase [Myxococcales bacterium]|nr:transposase [Myxococcales bacterium]
MGRRIKEFASLQGHDFKKYLRNESSAEVSLRLLGLAHVQEGKSCREVAKMLKVHENTIQGWVRRFAKSGFDGLQHQPGQGGKKRINPQDLPQIKAGILALQTTRTGGRISGQDVQKYLFDQWNISYKKSAVYDLLQSLNLVWISARSKHPSSDEAKQASFKKNF